MEAAASPGRSLCLKGCTSAARKNFMLTLELLDSYDCVIAPESVDLNAD